MGEREVEVTHSAGATRLRARLAVVLATGWLRLLDDDALRPEA